MLSRLVLKDAEPLVQGSRRLVFQHPYDEALLVKVMKSEAGREHAVSGLPWLPYRRANEMRRSYMREIGEYLRVRAKFEHEPLPIAKVFGLAETDRGMGIIVEKVCGADGALAQSLKARVHQQGFTGDMEARILALRDEVMRHDVVAGDINTNNIVWRFDSIAGERPVIVDGIGDKTFIPVNSLSRFVNRRSLMRRFRRVIARLKQIDADRTQRLAGVGH